jgi:hypothetical protein
MSGNRVIPLIGSAIVAHLFASATPISAQHQVAKLLPADVAAGDEFGRGAAVSGHVAVFGAYKQGCTSGSLCGAVYVFRWDGANWTQEQKLIPTDQQAGHYFGGATAIDGDAVLAGAATDGDPAGSGAAYVFRWNGSTWLQEAKLKAADAASQDQLGIAVAVQGTVAVAGAPLDDDAGEWSGSASVFRKGPSAWSQEAKLVASDAEAGDQFGISASVDGDLMVIGSHRDDAACPGDPDCDSGAAYVFYYDGANWIEEAKLTASDAAAGDAFGYSTQLSGSLVIAGSPGHDPAGAAYVFRREGNSWVQEAKLTPWDGDSGDQFGFVALHGDLALVGAGADDDACPGDPGCNSGAAYLFRRFGTSWAPISKLTAADAAAGDAFGWMKSVGLGEDSAVLGASLRDEQGLDAGAAYVFDLIGIPNVPTLTAWGVAALMLLVVTAATVVFVRRRTV